MYECYVGGQVCPKHGYVRGVLPECPGPVKMFREVWSMMLEILLSGIDALHKVVIGLK